ncbi:MAG: tRNA lysidine(34) synthetase, partial [Pseudomonadota bacterium]
RAEATYVADLCKRLQVPHKILTWEAPKPSQNAARQARFRLIAKAMAAAKSQVLMTGHTLDDVIETVFIRRRRGVRGGLSAGPSLTAPLPAWPEGRDRTVLRPLLRTRRSALRVYLREKNTDWIEDPSNQNLKYERVQVRGFFDRHPRLREAIIPAIAARLSERAQHDAAIGRALADVTVMTDGLIHVPTDQLSAGDTVRVLSLLARVASGGDRDPRHRAVIEMVDALDAVGARQTLGGAWFQRTQAGFKIGRDPVLAEPEIEGGVFDGRFVRDSDARFPAAEETSFLVRHARPPTSEWREILTDRIDHMRVCFRSGAGAAIVE